MEKPRLTGCVGWRVEDESDGRQAQTALDLSCGRLECRYFDTMDFFPDGDRVSLLIAVRSVVRGGLPIAPTGTFLIVTGVNLTSRPERFPGGQRYSQSTRIV